MPGELFEMNLDRGRNKNIQGVLRRAGVAVSVANGVAEAKAAAHYVTRASGGHGAVREIVELILKAQHKWDRIVAAHAA